MNLRTLKLSTSLVATFVQFSSMSYASNTNSFNELPDEMITEVFSHLSPSEVGNLTSVSKKFNQIACDSHTAYGKAKDLHDFCFTHRILTAEQWKELAKRVLALKTNPLAGKMSEEEFKEAQAIAQKVISSEKPSYIN